MIQGEEFSLESLRGRPAALIFWAPFQDEVIPTTDYYAHLAEQWSELGVKVVVVASAQHSLTDVQNYLAEHPMPGVDIAMDAAFRTYKDYNLSSRGYGLPRIILLDVDGKVAWEGDPGLRRGRGWSKGDGETFFDGALSNLVEMRMLREVIAAAENLSIAKQALARGDFKLALESCSKLTELDADWAPSVQQARSLQIRIGAIANQLIIDAREQELRGYPLLAEAMLQLGVEQFSGSNAIDLCQERLKELNKSSSLRNARAAWKNLSKAADEAKRQRELSRIIAHLDSAIKRDQSAQITEAHQLMREALLDDGAEAVLNVWLKIQPTQVCLERLLSSLNKAQHLQQ